MTRRSSFSNRWYAKGIETAVETELEERLVIRRLTPPLFIATKLEAYRGRGNNDLISSRDAEDILSIVDGTTELVSDIVKHKPEIRNYIAKQIGDILDDPNFEHFSAGNVRGPEGRIDIVHNRLVAIRRLGAGGTQASWGNTFGAMTKRCHDMILLPSRQTPRITADQHEPLSHCPIDEKVPTPHAH